MNTAMPSQTSSGDDPRNLQQPVDDKNRAHSHGNTPKCVGRMVPPQHDDCGPCPNYGEQTEHRHREACLRQHDRVSTVANAATAATVPDGYERAPVETLCRSTCLIR
jgi:hypothetical protein